MPQIGTSWSTWNKWYKVKQVFRSTWNKWNKEKGVFRSSWNKWNKDKWSVQLNLSTCSKVFVVLFVCLGFEDPSNHWTKRITNIRRPT